MINNNEMCIRNMLSCSDIIFGFPYYLSHNLFNKDVSSCVEVYSKLPLYNRFCCLYKGIDFYNLYDDDFFDSSSIFRFGLNLIKEKKIKEAIFFLTPYIEGVMINHVMSKGCFVHNLDKMGVDAHGFDRILISSCLKAACQKNKDNEDENSLKMKVYNTLESEYGKYFLLLYDYMFLDGSLARDHIRLFSNGISLRIKYKPNMLPERSAWKVRHNICHGIYSSIEEISLYAPYLMMFILVFFAFEPCDIKRITSKYNDALAKSSFIDTYIPVDNIFDIKGRFGTIF